MDWGSALTSRKPSVPWKRNGWFFAFVIHNHCSFQRVGEFVKGKSPAELHFCSSVEASIVLAEAGFGAAVIPQILVPHRTRLTAVKLTDAPELSFGMFYKPYPGNDVLRKFIQLSCHCEPVRRLVWQSVLQRLLFLSISVEYARAKGETDCHTSVRAGSQ